MRTTRAFTLVELLVTVTIITVIIGILLPSFHHVRSRARTAKCLANMRGLAQAHVMYTSAHRGRFVDVGLSHGAAPDQEELSWVTTLEALYDRELVLHSPLDDSPHWPRDEGGEGVLVPGGEDVGRLRRTSYGCNVFLSARLSPSINLYSPGEYDTSLIADRLSRVKDPSATVQWVTMAFEGTYAGSDHVHPEQWYQDPPVLAAGQVQTDAAGGPSRTAGARSNYAFLDGHVETRAFAGVFATHESNCFDPMVSWRWTVERTLAGGN